MNGADDTRDQAVSLLNDLQDISFARIALIVLGTWACIWLVRKSLPFLAERGPSQTRLYLLGSVPILRLALLGLAIAWIVPIVFNVTFQNFLVIAGALSVAVGFAFKDYVSSLIAGIVAVVERPYRPGDWVEIEGAYGEVKTVGLRALDVQTPDGNRVVVPHSVLWTDAVTNCSDGERTMQCTADFYLAPRHDAARVRSSLRDVALTSAFLDYSKPIVVNLSEQPWGTHYKVRAFPFDLRDQFLFVSDLTVRGKMAIAEAGAHESVTPRLPPGPWADRPSGRENEIELLADDQEIVVHHVRRFRERTGPEGPVRLAPPRKRPVAFALACRKSLVDIAEPAAKPRCRGV